MNAKTSRVAVGAVFAAAALGAALNEQIGVAVGLGVVAFAAVVAAFARTQALETVGSARVVVLVGVVACVLLLVGLLLSAVAGDGDGAGRSVGMAVLVVPVLAVFIYALHVDRSRRRSNEAPSPARDDPI